MALPDSEAFNIQFVQTIENYRCLYDISLHEYSSKDEQDKAWSQIAQMFSSTAAVCKLRWKYLRGGLTRYTKRLRGTSGQGAKKLKQFYLWDVMQFVIPYLKPRAQTGSLPPSCLGNDDQKLGKAELEDITEASEIPETSETHQPEANSVQTKRGRRTNVTTAKADDSFERSVSACVMKKPADTPENPDLDFFKSILPDMAQLNASQKRRFKVRVLQLLDEVTSE